MVIGVSGVSEDAIATFAEDNGITYPILHDTGAGGGPGFGGDTYDLYYIPSQGSPYPRDFIIDREGIIQYANNEIDTEYMLYVLESLMSDSVSVNEPEPMLPSGLILHQNYPNPFNPSTTIRFSVETHGDASLQIYDITGRLVETFEVGELVAGEYKVVWDASEYPSGVYFVRLAAGETRQTRKMLLLK